MARLHSDPAFLKILEAQFKNGYKVQYNLAPPILAKRDPVTGELQKQLFGPWVLTAFKLLAKLKGLRGGTFDLFGNTEERRLERQMMQDYIMQIDEIVSKLNDHNYAAAVQLASVPDEIRGYGHVKAKSIEAAKSLQEQCLQDFRKLNRVQLSASTGTIANASIFAIERQ